jgi:glc operon protein GlcG
MELRNRKDLTLDIAKKLADAAKAHAKRNGFSSMTVVVVDPGARLVYAERGDETAWGTVDVALLKAETAVRFERASESLEQALMNGFPGLVALPGVACFPGAVPVVTKDGQVLGAIGVSGLPPELDHASAQAGADALFKVVGASKPGARARTSATRRG